MKYVTKKQLRQELADERAWSASLEGENNSLTADLMAVRSQNTSLMAANQSLAGRATAYAAANRDLRQQLDTAKRAFGEAFVKGEPEPPKGPSRPNRKKLTKQEVKDIRDAYFGGAKQKDLARKFGVNPATISRTIRGVYH
ncbi:HTH DNA binding protein [Mycobacterium phage Piro94]|uniref:HTH DNA binding protein n=1 Tax=Mycobacterium phage Piro94 TaxID=1527520 RepID=A0A076YHL3_9CAUD|nr:HTH DNA binding protein [Mycobacterium phage Piro94]AIK67763.1 HTH DNA binding protein [Mycobacterium phage Piro94]ASZ72838.1 helix-turn-helix DNA-binding domain protein [Mycobacterium phage Drake55]UJD20976.1 helix-turn-helix DNA binding domain protein [Mycobacterium phage HarryHoudini]